MGSGPSETVTRIRTARRRMACTAPDELDRIATAVVYGGPRVDIGVEGAVVRLKLDACAAFVPTGREAAFATCRVTAARTAVWAAAAGFDRVLLDALTSSVERQSTSITSLEQTADRLLVLYQRVHALRTEIDALPLHLGGLDMPLWRAVDHVQTQLLAGASARRARRLSAFALVFTVASVVSLGITVVNFSQSRLRSVRGTNVAIFAASTVGVGAVAFAVARRDTR